MIRRNKRVLYESIMKDISKIIKQKLNNNYLTEGKWIPKEEWIKQQRELRKRNTCAFNDYDEVTQSMVDRFWENDRYAAKLIDINDIRPEWQNAYETAKKNVAMLDYAMSSSYSYNIQ